MRAETRTSPYPMCGLLIVVNRTQLSIRTIRSIRIVKELRNGRYAIEQPSEVEVDEIVRPTAQDF